MYGKITIDIAVVKIDGKSYCSLSIQDDDQATEEYPTKTYKELSYRCVRNLKNITSEINDFLKAEGSLSNTDKYEENTYRYFTNTYLNPKAIRANVTLPLGSNHTHLDEENRLPMKFQVGTRSAEKVIWGNEVKCPSGWRLPNQRELSIIAFHRHDNTSEEGSLHSATKSGLYDQSGLEDRRAYYVNSNNVVLRFLSDKLKANYRCVKDEIEK